MFIVGIPSDCDDDLDLFHSSLVLDDESEPLQDREMYKSMFSRDQRRFQKADKDGDGIATREEFTAFLHPEEFDYMKDLVVQVKHHWCDDATTFYILVMRTFCYSFWVLTGNHGGYGQER